MPTNIRHRMSASFSGIGPCVLYGCLCPSGWVSSMTWSVHSILIRKSKYILTLPS